MLLDWRNLSDGGVPVPFSVEMAHALIFDDAFADFREGALWACERVGRPPQNMAEPTTPKVETVRRGDLVEFRTQ